MYTLGLDIGTQSVKAIVYDSKCKKVVTTVSEKLPLISKEGGIREQKVSWYIDAIVKCLSEIDGKTKEKIEAIGVSGQQHGLVLLDDKSNVLKNVKLWCDTSSSKECEELTEAFGGENRLLEELGILILPGYTAGKILQLKKNENDIYEKTKTILLPHDYVNYYLTGRLSTEKGDASGTALLDIRKGVWNSKITSLIDDDLINKLPPIIGFDKALGKIRKEVASSLGLSEEVIVSPGGGDNMMAAIGTGCVKDGDVTMSLGTSGTLFTSTEKAIIDKDGYLATFCSSHNTYLPLLCTMNCTVSSEIWRKELGLSTKDFDALAEKAPIGSEGLLMLPFFNGERVPNYPNGKGVLAGIDMTNLKRQNICRSALEGVSFEFLLGLEALKKNGVDIKYISLTGGGANSPFWRKLIADMTNTEVRVPLVSEAAAFGAALQALAVKEDKSIAEVAYENVSFDQKKAVSPDKENNRTYLKFYDTWKKYVMALEPIFK